MLRFALLAAAASLLAGCVSFPAEGGMLLFQGQTTSERNGVEIMRVDEGSPLAAEGVRRGSVVTAVGGSPVATMDDLVEKVYLSGSVEPVRLTVDGREISVVPAKAERKITLSLGIPFFFRWDGDFVSFPAIDVLSIGTGPDWEGAELIDCVGYWNGPESREVSLVILGFGTRIMPCAPPGPSK